MAPIYTALGAWAAAGLPGATVFSLIILFVLTITVLALCTRCQKHSFDLQHDPPRERDSTLIRIVQLENVAVAVDNPAAADITRDEKDLGSLPGNGAIKPAGQQEPTTWRIHTIDRNPGRTINGDSNHIIQRPDPAVTEPPVTGTSLRTVDQTVLTYTEITSSTDRVVTDSEPPDFQTVSLEDQTEDTSSDLSSTLQVPHQTPQHMYETIGEVSVSADQSEMTLNPYAMYESIMTNSHEGNGSNLPPPPVLAEEPGEDLAGRNINDTYARISKKIKQSSPPLEEPAENMGEDGAPPYPESS